MSGSEVEEKHNQRGNNSSGDSGKDLPKDSGSGRSRNGNNGKEVDHYAVMGLKGIWAQIANLTAVAVLCVLFYQGFNAGIESMREERRLCREAVTRVELACNKQTKSIQEQTNAIEKLTRIIEKKQ